MGYKICNRCGYAATTDEIGWDKSFLCEIEGQSYYEDVLNNCPHCNGEFVDAVECKICGSYHEADTPHWYGYCDECLENEATFEMAMEIGKYNKESVQLNGLLTYMFTNEEIEKILLDYAANNQNKERNAKAYCLDDKMCLAEYLDEKCK